MMCGKKTYATFFEAEKALSTFKKGRTYGSRKIATKKPKRAYKCDVCGEYHLTSMGKIK